MGSILALLPILLIPVIVMYLLARKAPTGAEAAERAVAHDDHPTADGNAADVTVNSADPKQPESRLRPEEQTAEAPPELTALVPEWLKWPITRLHAAFAFEWAWRFYLCLQLLGIAVLVFVDVTAQRNWSVLPYFVDSGGAHHLEWDFFDTSHWNYHKENWVMLACLAAPFLLAKAVDWICSAPKDISKRQPGPK